MTTGIPSTVPIGELLATTADNEPVSAASSKHPFVSPREGEDLQRMFAENGYVILRNAVSSTKLAELNGKVWDELDKMKRSGRLAEMGGVVSGHLNCAPGVAARFICETLEERGIVDLLRSFTRRSITSPLVGINVNLPNSVVQHHHTDSKFSEEFLIVNVATVDTDLRNGAIEVVPGSHKASLPYWRFVVARMDREGVRLPLECGDVLIRTSNLWHRGMPNQTRTPRPMAGLSYFFQSPGEQARPIEVNGEEVIFFENWYKSDRLGRLRERVFAASPVTFAAYRFVSSLLGKKGYSTP